MKSTTSPSICPSRPADCRPKERRAKGRDAAPTGLGVLNNLLLHAAAEQSATPLPSNDLADILAAVRDPGDWDPPGGLAEEGVTPAGLTAKNDIVSFLTRPPSPGADEGLPAINLQQAANQP